MLLQVCINKYDLLNHNKLVSLVIIISHHSHLTRNKRPLQLLIGLVYPNMLIHLSDKCSFIQPSHLNPCILQIRF